MNEVLIRRDEGWMKQQMFFDSLNHAPLISLDIETFSPYGFPHNKGDPVVATSVAALIGRDMRDGLMLFSMICRPSSEGRLINWISKLFNSLSGSFLLTYNGKKFDLPYIKFRAERYGINLDGEIERLVHIDLYELVKRFRLSFPRYSQKVVEQCLGIRRQITDVNGGNFHMHFLNFLENGNVKPLLYNIEDSLLIHLILNSLKLRIKSGSVYGGKIHPRSCHTSIYRRC
jgi:uncharacterized protein YprB with RNaseH-like and TPR domain